MKRALPPMAFLALAPLLALAACETGGPPPPQPQGYGQPIHRPPPRDAATHYDADDFAWSGEAGANALSGRVAYRTKASAYSCAGGSVALTPETPYSSARTLRLYDSVQHAVTSPERVRERTTGEGAPAYAGFVRSATCDASGRFAFEALPDGAWFLITRAKPTHGDGAAVVIMKRVETRGGGSVVLELR